MTARPVVPRQEANSDIQDAIDHYAHEGGEEVALGFVDQIERAFSAISRNPAAGSPRYAYELDLPGLRTRATRRYPYLIFYLDRDDHIDVWRVLHAKRDIPTWLLDSDEH